MMISLTIPLAPQQVHVLGRQDEQGQAEPMRETAAATWVQRCAHRHPAADCDKLGGSGACPTWCVKGDRHTQTLPICSVQQQLSKPACLLPSGKPATSQHPWKERRGKKDRAVLVHPHGSAKQATILTLAGTQTQQPSRSQ